MRYRDKSRKPVLILSTAMAVAACLSAASVTALTAEGIVEQEQADRMNCGIEK